MKPLITLILLFCTYLTSVAQSTFNRNDAGLRGDAGATSGFFQTDSPINFPTVASNWWHLLDVRHTNGTNNYAMQFSGSFFDQDLYFRKTNDNAAQSWSKVLLEINGRLGIGTSTPSEKLSVYGVVNTSPGVISLESHRNDVTYAEVGALKGKNGTVEVARIGMLRGGETFSGVMNFFVKVGNDSPLFEAMRIAENGNVGIGTTTPNVKLAVNGNIRAKEIKVETTNWPDYVFDEDYKVGTLEELERYIKTNKHLPEMPTAKDVEANGVELGEMNKLLLKKVEELTLLLIDQNKKNEKQDEIINKLLKELNGIRKIK
jgi:hypothetical protein